MNNSTTKEQLVKQKLASIFLSFMFALCFLLVGFWLFNVLGLDHELICMRSTDKCIIQKINIMGNAEVDMVFNLRSISYAKVVKTDYIGDSASSPDYLYYVSIITDKGEFSLSKFSSSNEVMYTTKAKKINDFIKSDDEKLSVVESAGLLPKIMGALFMCYGGFIMFVTIKNL